MVWTGRFTCRKLLLDFNHWNFYKVVNKIYLSLKEKEESLSWHCVSEEQEKDSNNVSHVI